jgi:hypothetical protein
MAAGGRGGGLSLAKFLTLHVKNMYWVAQKMVKMNGCMDFNETLTSYVEHTSS